jgi:hypothetical protein
MTLNHVILVRIQARQQPNKTGKHFAAMGSLKCPQSVAALFVRLRLYLKTFLILDENSS